MTADIEEAAAGNEEMRSKADEMSAGSQEMVGDSQGMTDETGEMASESIAKGGEGRKITAKALEPMNSGPKSANLKSIPKGLNHSARR